MTHTHGHNLAVLLSHPEITSKHCSTEIEMDSHSFSSLNISNETDYNVTSPAFRCGVSPVLPPQVPPYIHTIQGVMILVIAIISVSLNGFLLALFIARQSLHQRSLCLPIQIIVIHLLASVTVLPTVVISAFSGRFLLGRMVCQLTGVFLEVFTAAKFMMTLAMALDRFLTVYMPFLYTRHAKKVLTFMSVTVWLLAIVMRGIVLLEGILDCFVYLPTFSSCAGFNCSKQCQTYLVTTIIMMGLGGMFTSFVLYVILYYKGRKLINKVSPNITLEPHEKTALKNRRVYVTMVLLFIAIMGCSTPPFAIYIAQIFKGEHTVVIILTVTVGQASFHSLTIADAVVLLNNSDVKKEIKKITQSIRRHINNMLSKDVKINPGATMSSSDELISNQSVTQHTRLSNKTQTTAHKVQVMPKDCTQKSRTVITDEKREYL